MKAIAEEEISFVAPILSLVPLSLLVVSPLITGDIPSQWGVVGVLVSVSGSVLLIDRKPQSDVDKARRRRAIVFSLIAVFCFSLNASFDRLAVKESSPLLSGGAMTLLATLFFLPTVWGRRDRYQEIRGAVKHLFLRGLFEITFMTLKLSALIFLQAPYVLALARTSLLLSIIGGRVLFKDHDFKRRIWAGVLITLGILTILFER